MAVEVGVAMADAEATQLPLAAAPALSSAALQGVDTVPAFLAEAAATVAAASLGALLATVAHGAYPILRLPSALSNEGPPTLSITPAIPTTTIGKIMTMITICFHAGGPAVG